MMRVVHDNLLITGWGRQRQRQRQRQTQRPARFERKRFCSVLFGSVEHGSNLAGRQNPQTSQFRLPAAPTSGRFFFVFLSFFLFFSFLK